MDIELLNFSEIARRAKISAVYVYHIMSGKRKPEKRLQQIADILRMSVHDLKKQIERNRMRIK